MLGLLTRLRPKLWALAGAVLAFAALILRNRQLKYSRDKARYRAQVARAGLERKQETEEREAEIAQEWSDYEREAKRDLDTVPDILSKPRSR